MMMFLDHARQINTKKDLADFTGMTMRALTLMLQKLEAKKLIRTTEHPAEKKTKSGVPVHSPQKLLDIVFLSDSEPILQELQTVQNVSIRFVLQAWMMRNWYSMLSSPKKSARTSETLL